MYTIALKSRLQPLVAHLCCLSQKLFTNPIIVVVDAHFNGSFWPEDTQCYYILLSTKARLIFFSVKPQFLYGDFSFSDDCTKAQAVTVPKEM